MTARNSGSEPADDTRESRIPAELSGQRLDQALAQLFPEYSRSRLSQWIKEGRVLVDDAAARPRDAVMGGQKIQLSVPQEPLSNMAPEALPLEIVYEDAALIVVNKPVGMVVHPGAGNHSGTLQNALLHHAPELAQVPRAGLVHRIDKDTSGLLVVARTLEAHTVLVAALQAREFERGYVAVTLGVMTGGGTVDAPIKRHPTDRIRMSVREGGRESVTHYRVLKRFRAHTYITVELETGRTHQIRVHLAHIKYPLVGDQVYGRRLGPPRNASPKLQETLRAFHRQALHAQKLGLTHPSSGEQLLWEVPPPADFQALLAALEEDLAHAG
jgi:23S rRNA pseudouridine1911/1915/1917 synthase